MFFFFIFGLLKIFSSFFLQTVSVHCKLAHNHTQTRAFSRLFAGKCARTLIVCDFLYVGPIFAKFLHINCWNHRLVVGQCYENFFLSFGYVGVQNWQFKPICPGDCSWIHTEIETKKHSLLDKNKASSLRRSG